MKFLRTASTRRLLAMLAGLLTAVAGGTAIALAASGGGPVPRPKPLASAIHDALTARTVPGISARVAFTNHLIDSSDFQGTDPIVQGATGRLWLSPGRHQARLELQSDNGDAQAVVNNGSFWVYDPSSKTVYQGNLPASASPSHKNAKGKSHKTRSQAGHIPTVAQIQKQLNDVVKRALLSRAIPSDVGGQPAYTVRIAPRHDGGLLGAAELAWDSNHGLPLRVAVYARGDTSPVLELKVTDISYGPVSSSVFAIHPPGGAKVVKISPHDGAAGRAGLARHPRESKRHAEVAGIKAVAARVSFPLVAPASLVGLPRRSVTLLDWAGSPAALVTYGQNLGGIAVIEQTARSDSGAAAQALAARGGERRGFNLPSVSINGATGEELDTALGTMVRFTRAGVGYIVVGSVPPAAADAAARAL